MKIALTGTPGTGKTTISNVLKDEFGLKVVDLNKVISAFQYYIGWDDNRICGVVDLEALRAHPFEDGLVIEGHISHHLSVERVIVLRTNPAVLRGRLQEKGFQRTRYAKISKLKSLTSSLLKLLGCTGITYMKLTRQEDCVQQRSLCGRLRKGIR